MSDSEENEDFLSADEFASDTESACHVKAGKHTSIGASCDSAERDVHAAVKQAPKDTDQEVQVKVDDVVKEIVHSSPESVKGVPSAGKSNQGDSLEEDEEVTEVRSYRKRPERPRKPSNSSVLKKPDLNPIVDIVKSARPDTIINEFKSQLTSNISKGFATFQETSSSLKGLVIGNFAPEISRQNKEDMEFVYDDNRLSQTRKEEKKTSTQDKTDNPLVEPFPLEARSALNQEILNLSNAFAKLNEARDTSEVPEHGKKVGGSEALVETDALEGLNDAKPDQVLVEGNDKAEQVRAESDGWDLEHLEPNNNRGGESESKEVPSESQSLLYGESIECLVESWPEEAAEVQVRSDATPGNVGRSSASALDGWGTWNDDDSPLETINENDSPDEDDDATARESDLTAAVNDKSADTNRTNPAEEKTELMVSLDKLVDGWDDWNDSEAEQGGEKELKAEKQIDKDAELKESVESLQEKEEQGWDDWGDDEEVTSPEQVNEKAPSPLKESNDDGWGDWGDEDSDEPPPKEDNRRKADAEPRPVGSLAVRSSQQQKDWKGWDSFGQKKDSDWGLGGWGINTLSTVLSTATTVTSNLSAAIESGLGVPDPATMARIQREEEQAEKQEPKQDITKEEPSTQFPFRHIVAGVGKMVEVAKVQEIGSLVLSGGLDTLETIGKKTMAVLQEGDPGLKKKRALLVGQGQMLSHVLREARDRAAVEDKKAGELAASRRCHFETLFDDFQGLVHLEALEMLSRQCELRLEQIQRALGPAEVHELEDTMDEVRQLCEVEEDFGLADLDDFPQAITDAAHPLRNELSLAKILEVHARLISWLKAEETSETTPSAIYDQAITTIAELTAAVTMQFHKSGELLLLKERRKTVEEADSLLQLSSNLCSELRAITDALATQLSKRNEAEVPTLVSNLRVEAENATAYIKQALGLLVPVLQLGAT